MKESGIENFVDFEFPPMMASLHDPTENFPHGSDISWKRAKDFLVPLNGRNPQMFGRETLVPGDIIPGSLGDSWFASALACLSEKESLIRKLFITQSYHNDGVYKIQICKGGIWREMTVDDYFPCSATTNAMALFTRSKQHLLWVLLLEKAYAKVHQNYYTLRGGLVSEALADLTGFPTEMIPLDRDDTVRNMQQGRFFLQMSQNLFNGYLIAASTEGEELWAEIDEY